MILLEGHSDGIYKRLGLFFSFCQQQKIRELHQKHHSPYTIRHRPGNVFWICFSVCRGGNHGIGRMTCGLVSQRPTFIPLYVSVHGFKRKRTVVDRASVRKTLLLLQDFLRRCFALSLSVSLSRVEINKTNPGDATSERSLASRPKVHTSWHSKHVVLDACVPFLYKKYSFQYLQAFKVN